MIQKKQNRKFLNNNSFTTDEVWQFRLGAN